MTKMERGEGKQLYEKAKEMSKAEQGKYQYRVRGPPWDRRIVKMQV